MLGRVVENLESCFVSLLFGREWHKHQVLGVVSLELGLPLVGVPHGLPVGCINVHPM